MSRWIPAKGELVVVWKDNGTAVVTTVRDAGDHGGLDVVWLEGVSGFYAKRCVRPLTFHPSAKQLLGAAVEAM